MKSVALLLLASASALAGCTEDLPGPAPVACPEPLTLTAYRIDRVDVAGNAVDAANLGLDLDGDLTIDNQAGNVLSAMFWLLEDQDASARYHRQLEQRLAGDLDWQLELSTCPSTGESRLSPINDVIPLGALADLVGGGDDDWHPTTAATIQFQISRRGITGQLGFGLAPGYADIYARGFVPMLDERIASGDRLDTDNVNDFIAAIDADQNDTIAEVELQVAPLFTTMTRPDLDTDDDGEADSLSLGLGFHATAIPPSP